MRISAKPTTDFGRSRPPVSVEADHRFQWMATTHFADGDHPPARVRWTSAIAFSARFSDGWDDPSFRPGLTGPSYDRRVGP
jgi:hypothetical protein